MDPVDEFHGPYSYGPNNPIDGIDIDGLYWDDFDGDNIADTWVWEDQTPMVEAEMPIFHLLDSPLPL